MELGHTKKIAIQKNNLRKMEILTLLQDADVSLICAMVPQKSQQGLASSSFMLLSTIGCIIFLINYFDCFLEIKTVYFQGKQMIRPFV